MLVDDTTLHTTGKSVVQIQKTLQLCLDRISVWGNVNYMLISPVKTKSMIITIRQKAPALRLVTETVTGWSEYWKCNWTSPTRSHRRQQIPMASPDRTHMQKHIKKTVSSFSTATYHQHRYQKTLLQRSHKTSHRLWVSSVRWIWRGTLKKTASKGRQIIPSCSFAIYRAKDECTWNFKPTATSRLQSRKMYA